MDADIAERYEQKWPWDFDTLRKGDSISEVELLRASGLEKHSPQYGFYCMGLRDAIMLYKAEMGEPLVVAIVKGALVLLEDLDAAEYTEKLFRSYLRGTVRLHGYQLQVDDSAFTDAERGTHRRRLEVNGRTIQGALLGRKNKLVLNPTERKTPTLPS